MTTIEVVGARNWRDLSACLGEDPELFFPTAEPGTAMYEAQVAQAKTVCGGCPVRLQCLTYALEAISDGVAGGMTSTERRAERRRQRATVRRAVAVASAPAPARLLEVARPASASRDEVKAAGLALLAAGHSARAAAERLGVSERTVSRWAAGARRGVAA